MIRALLYKLFDRAIDWVFRPRNVGVVLLGAGIALLGAAFSIDFLTQIDFRDASHSFTFKFTTGEGLPRWASFGVYGLGWVLTSMGGLILGCQMWSDYKKDRRQIHIIIELRGLQSSPDTPAKSVNLGAVRGERQWVLIDFRPQKADDLVDPELMLERVRSIQPTIHALANGRDKSDVFLAVGGLAAVPALFLAGMLVDDESSVTLYDWARDPKDWRLVEGPDDGTRFLPLVQEIDGTDSTEAVLAIAVSYTIQAVALRQTFGNDLSVFRLTAQNVVVDRHWSNTKQQALVREFRDTVQILMARGVQKIHLVLAAPASLCIRMGMAYDGRLMPELFVYQFERSANPPYPWAVEMPSHGRAMPRIIRISNSQSAAKP